MPSFRVPPWLRATLPIAVAVALIAWLLSRADLHLLARTLRGADPLWFAAALVVSVVTNLTIPVAKWRTILVRMGYHIPYRQALVALLGCFPFRFSTPLKVGEVLKAVYLNRKLGIPLEESFASVAFDKATNIAAVAAMAIAGVFVLDLGMNRPLTLAILLPIFLAASQSRVQRAILPVARALSARLGRFLERLLAAFHEIPPTRRAPIWALTILILLTETAVYSLSARTMGFRVPYGRILFGMPLVILFANIPVSLGGVGIRETAMVYLFSPAGTPEQLLAWGLCVSVVDPFMMVALGLPFVRSFTAGTLQAEPRIAAGLDPTEPRSAGMGVRP